PPIEQVDMPPGRDTMSLGFLMGEILENGNGAYRAVATAPDGERYERTLVPTDDTRTLIDAVRVEDPAGTWTLEAEAAGSGIVIIEAIAYNATTSALGPDPA
ncbi:MAG: hypothetical protein R3185_08715, partial [Candidatus Thermoplasmatota archaeon]|nr:hypothetical protein [Candidatus Thermoplasmatota archaeon]